MKLVTKILVMLLTVSMLSFISACGADKTATADTTAAPQATSKVSAPVEKVNLKLLTSQTLESKEKDSRTLAFYNAIDEYKAANPDVKIEVEAIPSEPYNDKAKILAAGNELPDMLEVLGSWTKEFVKSGLLLDLTDDINGDSAWKAIIKPTAVNNYKVDGKIYGICLEGGGSTTLLFYNSAILKECGLEGPPKTMTELKAAIKAIKAKGYTPISLGNKGNWVAQSCYLSAIGSRYTGVDWEWSIANRTGAKFTDPEFIKGMTVLQDLANAGAFNKDMNSIDYKQQRVPYFNGKAAMFIEGFWAISSCLKDCPKDVLDNTHVMGIPDCEDAKVPDAITGGNGAWAWSLNSKLSGASRDAAIGFMKTLLSQKSAKTVLEGGNPCSIDPGTYDTSKLAPLQVECFELMNKVPFCETYDVIFQPNVIDVMNKGLQELLINMVTPEELAKRIQAEYEKVQG